MSCYLPHAKLASHMSIVLVVLCAFPVEVDFLYYLADDLGCLLVRLQQLLAFLTFLLDTIILV